tara:strand:+ start:1926 stop:2474 length:549 start_codon:yes stop_codon:yes gene_type:complete
MGSPKPLLAWRDTTLIEYQIGCLLEGGASEVIVVLGHRAGDIVQHVKGDNVGCVVNPRYREGRSTSVVVGIEAVSSSSQAVMLLAIDQPRTPEIVSQIVEAHASSDAVITSPRYVGHGGHPLIFSASLKPELMSISEERHGIREVFERHRDAVLELPLDDPMIRLDFNTPTEYEEARLRYGA